MPLSANISTSYYRAHINNIRIESKSIFNPIMAGEGPHQAMPWRLANQRKIQQNVLHFCSDSTLSEFFCWRCPFVPILQGWHHQYQQR
jgi:hypothetical protein